jgi:lipoprotein-releasing system permease protein
LILDKKEDIATYKALGMPMRKIISIFKTEGNLITLAGGGVGMAIGLIVCLVQEKYGIIKLGSGAYVADAYPVNVIVLDVILVLIAVFSIGYIASYFPVRYLITRLANKK